MCFWWNKARVSLEKLTTQTKHTTPSPTRWVTLLIILSLLSFCWLILIMQREVWSIDVPLLKWHQTLRIDSSNMIFFLCKSSNMILVVHAIDSQQNVKWYLMFASVVWYFEIKLFISYDSNNHMLRFISKIWLMPKLIYSWIQFVSIVYTWFHFNIRLFTYSESRYWYVRSCINWLIDITWLSFFYQKFHMQTNLELWFLEFFDKLGTKGSRLCIISNAATKNYQIKLIIYPRHIFNEFAFPCLSLKASKLRMFHEEDNHSVRSICHFEHLVFKNVRCRKVEDYNHFSHYKSMFSNWKKTMEDYVLSISVYPQFR